MILSTPAPKLKYPLLSARPVNGAGGWGRRGRREEIKKNER